MRINECLFVAIGEGAGKVIDELMNKDKRYVSLFINTNYEDIKKLKNAKNIYVPAGNAKGSGRDRGKAKEYAKEYFPAMIDSITDFQLQNKIFICYSMDGGSGSGIAPVILRMLTKMNAERGLGKKINLIGILPSLDVSKDGLSNTIDCWNETIGIKGINSMYFIDNNRRESLKEINVEFSRLFDNAMKIPNQIGGEGTMIDSSDLEKIMLAKGCNAIYELPKDEEDTKIATVKAIKNSIFSDFNTINCTHILTSFNKFNHKEVRNEFHAREEYLEGYNNNSNIVVASGFKPPMNVIEYIQMELQERLSKINDEEDDFSSYIIQNKSVSNKATVKKEQSKIEEPKQQEEDLDKLFDDKFWEDIF